MYSIRERLCFKPKYIHFLIFIRSFCCFSFLSSPRGSVCGFVPLFFSSQGARGHAVVMVNDPFSDLPFFWYWRIRMIWDHKSVFGFSQKTQPNTLGIQNRMDAKSRCFLSGDVTRSSPERTLKTGFKMATSFPGSLPYPSGLILLSHRIKKNIRI